ncbi:MAG: TonB-dependent receptor plug domain-containing protein, partial [Cyclobacteriaceae bacterium]|nr:TonB-dependent receptor plug domain-containing protein [Cyclobacteriaceae bacterium]
MKKGYLLMAMILCFAISAQAQDITITGTVTSVEDESGLPGVNVIVKGTAQGTVTDIEGKYSLNVPGGESILVFSSVGFTKEEVVVGNQTVIDLVLNPDLTALEEIVVIGYGSVKKSDLTGAVSSVKGEELERTPMQSIDQGLIGRAAGVVVTQTSGMPGSTASIRVRGTTSLQGGNEPLYVIDGFPIYAGSGYGNTSGTGNRERISSMATLNPNDIESIEILKDASATSIYGARAANGVVLITTKTGKAGQDQISFNAYYGVQEVVQKLDVMNALEYADLVNEAYTNDGDAPYYDNAAMDQIRQNP